MRFFCYAAPMQANNKATNRLRLYFMIAAILIAVPSVVKLYSGHTGKLLVATDNMRGDPFFYQKVIYVFDHSLWGAKGIIINQPLKNKDPEKFGVHHRRSNLYNGGPVAYPTLKTIALKRPKAASRWRIQPLTVVDYKGFERFFPSYADKNAELDVYLGYSGWDFGKLENEIKNGMWVVVDCNISKLNTDVSNSELWEYLSNKDEKNICQ